MAAQISETVFSPHSCRRSGRVLAFFVIFGLLAGSLFGWISNSSSWMLGRIGSSVSIVRLIATNFLPFLISMAASFVDAGFLFPICWCKAFLFGFVHIGVFSSFGSGGWLLRWLVLFADCAAFPLLYWFWLRLLEAENHGYSDFLWCTLAVFGIGFLDFYIIAPIFRAF